MKSRRVFIVSGVAICALIAAAAVVDGYVTTRVEKDPTSILGVAESPPASLKPATLEEAIAGLYQNKLGDLHRIDDHTVANRSDVQFLTLDRSNCVGAISSPRRPEPEFSASTNFYSDNQQETNISSLDSVAIRQEFRFNEVTRAKVRLATKADKEDYDEGDLIIEGSSGSKVLCNVFASGKTYCYNSKSFARHLEGVQDTREREQIVDEAARVIFSGLCINTPR